MTYRSGYLVGASYTGLGGRRTLGDYYPDSTVDAAGSGTSSGNGLFAQLWGYITGTVAAASDDPPAVVAWRQQATAAGSVCVRWPFNDAFHGELAERWANYDSDGVAILGYSYALAPLDVINADRARRGVDAIATNVLLPLAEGGETFAHVITSTIGRAALVAGGAVLAINLLMRAGRR